MQVEAGQLYTIDGGVFKAKLNQETQELELWTYMGIEGHSVLRTGFEIGEHGGLYDRLWDLENERYQVLNFPRFTLEDLTPVTNEQATDWDSTITFDELLKRHPELEERLDLDDLD